MYTLYLEFKYLAVLNICDWKEKVSGLAPCIFPCATFICTFYIDQMYLDSFILVPVLTSCQISLNGIHVFSYS